MAENMLALNGTDRKWLGLLSVRVSVGPKHIRRASLEHSSSPEHFFQFHYLVTDSRFEAGF